jgi:hypothetical protein
MMETPCGRTLPQQGTPCSRSAFGHGNSPEAFLGALSPDHNFQGEEEMTKKRLVSDLRRRQYVAGAVPRYVVDALSDDEIVDSYITCSYCSAKLIGDVALTIRASDSTEDFLAQLEVHFCSTLNRTVAMTTSS